MNLFFKKSIPALLDLSISVDFILECLRQGKQMNHESDPQSCETSLQFESCIFLFLRGNLPPCGSSAWFLKFLCLWVWVWLPTPLSPTSSPQLCCRARQHKLAPKQRLQGEESCQRSTRLALVSTAPHSAPTHARISTQGTACCSKVKRTRIRMKIPSEHCLHTRKPPCPAGAECSSHSCRWAPKGSLRPRSRNIQPDYLLRCFIL